MAQVALHDVSFTLSEGVIALLGANGSGKSTLLRVLATLCQPDAGELSFAGQRYGRDQRALRTQIGYLPQDLELPATLTPRKLLTYLARLRGGGPSRKMPLAVLHLGNIPDHPLFPPAFQRTNAPRGDRSSAAQPTPSAAAG